jgi:DNA gyrase subunit A
VAYVQKVYSLPYTRSGFGEPVQNLFKFGDGERVIKMLPLLSEQSVEAQEATRGEQQSLPLDGIGMEEDQELLLVNSGGYGFRFPVANLAETTRSGKKIMTLKNDNRLVSVIPMTGTHAFLLSEAGKGLLVDLEQITQLSGAGVGVRLINVGNSRFLAAKCVKQKETVELVFEDGKTKDIKMTGVPEYNRGSQGVTIFKRGKVVRIN